MDLVSECSVQDDQVGPGTVSPPPPPPPPPPPAGADDDPSLLISTNNGSCAIANHTHNNLPSPTSPNQSPEFDSNSKSPTTKGYGLKKWRRIKRTHLLKDTTTTTTSPTALDSSKILKRLLPGNVNSNHPHPHPHPPPTTSEASVGSPNVFKNVDGFGIRPSDSDSRIAVASSFAAATDSENSEDRSSKSSTAASAPKHRFDLPKNKGKGMTAKNSATASQKVPQGKGKMEMSKKPRGERIRIEKENSHSSIESDSRSSHFFFTQGTNVTSNGKQIGRSLSYDGENSDEAHASEQQFSEEVQTGYSKENAGEVEDSQDDSTANASWGVKDEKSDRDPLLESILTLQSLQEALEKEVQKFSEIGKEPILPDSSMEGSSVPSDFAGQGIQEHYPSSQLGSEKSMQIDVSSLQEKVLSLEQNVKTLESKLDEAKTLLVVKESTVAELEATISCTKFVKEESGSTTELQEKKYAEIEDELEGLFKRRIEAEVEFLAITRTTQSLKVVAEKQTTLLEEQETVAEKQAQMLNLLGDAEIKATKLKKQALELENHCDDILGTEEVLVTQRGVYKVTWCFCAQLILLILVVWLFVSQLSPHPGAFVPT